MHKLILDIRRLTRSFTYALDGVNYALNHDQNLVIHFIAATFVIILSIIFDISAFEQGILGITILLVISAEMINSALEKMVDLITKEHHEEAKIAKDIAAGMVLITSLGAVVVGSLIFLPHILHYLYIAP